MSIQPSESSTQAYPINAAYQSNAKLDVQANKTDKTSGQPEDAKLEQAISKETLKTQTQASLIQHLFGEGAPKNENALRILYQETVDKLNEVLAPDLGPNAISAEKLAEQGGMEYWSPENTANRIVQGTVGFFEAYKTSNPDLQGEALLDKFLSVIGGGIEKGFEEAGSILKGFGVYDGSVKDNAEKTYELVQKGLQAFREQQMEQMGLKPATTDENSVA
jgi:hypothetical protein